jgi:hypothetical protein
VSSGRAFALTISRCEVIVLVPNHIGFAVERDSKTPPAEFEKCSSVVYGLQWERDRELMEWLCCRSRRSCLQLEERRWIEVDFVSLERVFFPTSSRCEVVALVRERSEFAAQGGSKTPPAELEK